MIDQRPRALARHQGPMSELAKLLLALSFVLASLYACVSAAW